MSSEKNILNHCAVIILAAGSSSRLGRPKQLLPYKGKTLLQHMIDTAQKATMRPVVLVLGANSDLISNEIMPNDTIHRVINEQWGDGISTSIRRGLLYLQQVSTSCDGVILMLCDQPFITPALLNELIKEQRKTGHPIVASTYENTLGTPALFCKALFPELLALTGDSGAKKILMEGKYSVATVSFPMGKIDVNTSESYDALVQANFDIDGNNNE